MFWFLCLSNFTIIFLSSIQLSGEPGRVHEWRADLQWTRRMQVSQEWTRGHQKMWLRGRIFWKILRRLRRGKWDVQWRFLAEWHCWGVQFLVKQCDLSNWSKQFLNRLDASSIDCASSVTCITNLSPCPTSAPPSSSTELIKSISIPDPVKES